MQIPIIKKLTETYTLIQLKSAETSLEEEETLEIEVEGEDEGEQLTHIIAAIWILEKMEANDIAFGKALREYTQKVRTSIGG